MTNHCVIKTQFGYHIIEVQTPAQKIASLDAVKPQLIADLQKNQKANALSNIVNKLNDSVIGNDALDVVTQQVKTAKVQSAKAVTVWTKDPYLADASVKAKLFSDDVKTGDRNASSSVQLANGDVIWVKVRNYRAAGTQTLAQATAAIRNKVLDQKAEVIAKQRLATTFNGFKSKPAEQVLAQSSIKFEKAGVFPRQGLKKEVSNIAFTLPTPKAGMWSVGTTTLPNEMVVIAVSKVEPMDPKAISAEQMQQLQNWYQQSRSEQELADYVEYLKSKAKIK